MVSLRRLFLLGLVCLVASSSSILSTSAQGPNNPVQLTVDGPVYTQFTPTTGLNFFELTLHSYKKLQDAVANNKSVTIPPLNLFWTNYTTPVGQPSLNTPPIYVSWNNNLPNPSSYDFMTTNGLLTIPGPDVVGQYALYIALDMTGFEPTEFSFAASVFNPIPLQTCGSFSQMGYAPDGSTVQFVLQRQDGHDVTITAILAIDDQAKQAAFNSAIILYVSTSPNPSSNQYIWTTWESSITISHSDPNYPPAGQPFYISVYGQVDSPFVITAETTCGNSTVQPKIALE